MPVLESGTRPNHNQASQTEVDLTQDGTLAPVPGGVDAVRAELAGNPTARSLDPEERSDGAHNLGANVGNGVNDVPLEDIQKSIDQLRSQAVLGPEEISHVTLGEAQHALGVLEGGQPLSGYGALTEAQLALQEAKDVRANAARTARVQESEEQAERREQGAAGIGESSIGSQSTGIEDSLGIPSKAGVIPSGEVGAAGIGESSVGSQSTGSGDSLGLPSGPGEAGGAEVAHETTGRLQTGEGDRSALPHDEIQIDRNDPLSAAELERRSRTADTQQSQLEVGRYYEAQVTNIGGFPLNEQNQASFQLVGNGLNGVLHVRGLRIVIPDPNGGRDSTLEMDGEIAVSAENCEAYEHYASAALNRRAA